MARQTPDDSIAVFCGAGFSAMAGYPTMASFDHALRRCPSLTDADIAKYDCIVRTCSGMALLIDESITGIEQLTLFISMLSLRDSEFVFRDGTTEFRPSDAMRVITKALYYLFYPTNRTSGETLAVHAAQCGNLDFITTNYDLNIETGLAQLGLPFSYFCKPSTNYSSELHPPNSEACSARDNHERFLRVSNNQFKRKHVRIAKLHGSVNWSGDGEDCLIEDRWNRKLNENGTELGFVLDQNAWHNAILSEPSVLKRPANEMLRSQWEGAHRILNNCNVLIFVGYSCPESDAYMRYFISSCLHDNMKLRKIYIVDPSTSTLGRYQQLLFPSARHRGIVELMPFRWEQIHRLTNFCLAMCRADWDPAQLPQELLKEISSLNEKRAALAGGFQAVTDGVASDGIRSRGRSRSRA